MYPHWCVSTHLHPPKHKWHQQPHPTALSGWPGEGRVLLRLSYMLLHVPLHAWTQVFPYITQDITLHKMFLANRYECVHVPTSTVLSFCPRIHEHIGEKDTTRNHRKDICREFISFCFCLLKTVQRVSPVGNAIQWSYTLVSFFILFLFIFPPGFPKSYVLLLELRRYMLLTWS